MMRSVLVRGGIAAAAFLGVLQAPGQVAPRSHAQASETADIPLPVIPLTAPMPEGRACRVPAEFTDLVYRLPRVAAKIEGGWPITIVALGSSSTEGVGASSPFMSYPARLQDELRRMYQTDAITVLNRGVGGEKAGDMLARLEKDVLSANPDLVIFQGDVNSVLADAPIALAVSAMNDVIATLRARHVDVVLMDAQYAPRVNAMASAGEMQAETMRLGQTHRVGVFQRHALMKRWRDADGLAYGDFLAADKLHMKDWSYACTARVLAHAIGNAASPYAFVSLRHGGGADRYHGMLARNGL